MEYQIEIENAGQTRTFPLFGKIRQNFVYDIYDMNGKLQSGISLFMSGSKGYPTYEAALAAAKQEVTRLERNRLARAEVVKGRVIIDGADLLV